MKEEELRGASRQGTQSLSNLKFAHANLVQRVGYMENISFTFSQSLADFTFAFERNGSTVSYVVKESFIKRKIQKKTSAVYS